MPKPHPLNVPGDFYIEYGCCIACGIMHEETALLTWDGASHCFVGRQPETPEEVTRLIRAMAFGDVDCLRYAGRDPTVMARIAAVGARQQIDARAQTFPTFSPKTHVTFRRSDGRHTRPFDVAEVIRAEIERAMHLRLAHWHPVVGLSWSVRFAGLGAMQRIEVSPEGEEPDRLLIRLHPAEPNDWFALALNAEEWLSRNGFADLRWRSAEAWIERGAWTSGPV